MRDNNNDFGIRSDFALDAEDHAEIERLAERTHALAERTNAMNRRKFISASAGILTFVLPAIGTYVVPSEALGGVGSGRMMMHMHMHMRMHWRKRWWRWW